jgi:hypothetical protein
MRESLMVSVKIDQTLRKMRESLMVSVKIDHNEALKIVISDLIAKRNSPTNNIRDSFDAVLRYYLEEAEFEKYVLHGKPIR